MAVLSNSAPIDALNSLFSPKLTLIDLHRHLDGSLRLETILDFGRQHNLPLPVWDVEVLRPHVQVAEPRPVVIAFVHKFRWMILHNRLIV